MAKRGKSGKPGKRKKGRPRNAAKLELLAKITETGLELARAQVEFQKKMPPPLGPYWFAKVSIWRRELLPKRKGVRLEPPNAKETGLLRQLATGLEGFVEHYSRSARIRSKFIRLQKELAKKGWAPGNHAGVVETERGFLEYDIKELARAMADLQKVKGILAKLN